LHFSETTGELKEMFADLAVFNFKFQGTMKTRLGLS